MKFNKKRKLIAIVGPTASGKTSVGVRLAKEFNGEIVSADSRQVYRGLDIGTGKDLSEYDGVKYHAIDICDPCTSESYRTDRCDKFTLFDYLSRTREAIEDIFSRGKVPIIVGGTGLYIQALIEGFRLESITNSKSQISNQIPNSKSKIFNRDQLNNKTIKQLQEILQELNVEAYKNLADKQNPHRLIRAIEKAQEGLKPTKIKPDFDVLQIGITWPREILYRRIDQRVDERFNEGMLEEVKGLLKSGVDPIWLFQLGLEYRVITSFLISNFKFQISNKTQKSEIQKLTENSKLKFNDFDNMSQVLKYKIHQFARRQLTWFRRFSEIIWENDFNKIKKIVKDFLY